MSYSFFWAIPQRLNLLYRRFETFSLIFMGRLNGLWRWNRVFRNVGTENSDAGESPKRNNTTKKPPALLFLSVTGLDHNRRTTFHVVTLRALDFPIVSQFKRRLIYRRVKSQTCFIICHLLSCVAGGYELRNNSCWLFGVAYTSLTNNR
jgi:hypothetical protein